MRLIPFYKIWPRLKSQKCGECCKKISVLTLFLGAVGMKGRKASPVGAVSFFTSHGSPRTRSRVRSGRPVGRSAGQTPGFERTRLRTSGDLKAIFGRYSKETVSRIVDETNGDKETVISLLYSLNIHLCVDILHR